MFRDLRALVALALVAPTVACGASAASPTVATTTARDEIVVRTTNGYRIEGTSVWQGRYVCTQGVTGLTLELVGSGSAAVSAVFRFYEVPENPGVPFGSYTLVGTIRGDGTIDLVPEGWLEQPHGYVMVGMTGMLDRATGVLRGAITNPACAEFDLRRVR